MPNSGVAMADVHSVAQMQRAGLPPAPPVMNEATIAWAAISLPS
jgi:hypothetical protein